MNFKKIQSHFLQLKLLKQVPNHVLISSNTISLDKVVTSLLKILNCPYQGECLDKCSQCQRLESKDEDLVFKIEPTPNSITREQIDNLRNWSYLHVSQKNYKFFWITHAELLTPSASNQLLKFLEESPVGIIGIFTSENTEYLPKTLLSRLQIFKIDDYRHNNSDDFKDFSLTPSEQKILKQISNAQLSLNNDFITNKFIPLKLQGDLFFQHLYKEEVDYFLIQANELLLLENFYLFLQILILQIKGVLFNDESFADEKKLCQKHINKLPKLLKYNLELLRKNNFLFQKTKNKLSAKIVFLDFIHFSHALFSN